MSVPRYNTFGMVNLAPQLGQLLAKSCNILTIQAGVEVPSENTDSASSSSFENCPTTSHSPQEIADKNEMGILSSPLVYIAPQVENAY